jgi:hypothetical protein
MDVLRCLYLHPLGMTKLLDTINCFFEGHLRMHFVCPEVVHLQHPFEVCVLNKRVGYQR